MAEGRRPALSPDGQWVAFHGGRESRIAGGFYRDLMLIATSGGRPRLLARATEDPVWSPDAKRLAAAQRLSGEIAFARIVPYRGWGAHEVWRVRPDGDGRRLITRTPRSLLGQGITGLVPIAWSASGRFVLVSDSGFDVTRDTRVEIVPYAGGGPPVVVARRAGEASWNR